MQITSDQAAQGQALHVCTQWFVHTQGAFKLEVEQGEFTDSEILVMLGENGTGKTTFIRMLAGGLKPDDEETDIPQFRVSYKPQKISPKFPGTVRPHQNVMWTVRERALMV